MGILVEHHRRRLADAGFGRKHVRMMRAFAGLEYSVTIDVILASPYEHTISLGLLCTTLYNYSDLAPFW